MSDPPSRLAAFLAELKRRRVFRVAVVYAGVAFIIFQIIDAIFEPLHIPAWVGTTIIILLLIGFPIAVGLAWAFDITDKGLVRTRGKAQASATSRRPILTNWTLGIFFWEIMKPTVTSLVLRFRIHAVRTLQYGWG